MCTKPHKRLLNKLKARDLDVQRKDALNRKNTNKRINCKQLPIYKISYVVPFANNYVPISNTCILYTIFFN